MKEILVVIAMLICSSPFGQANFDLEWESPVGEIYVDLAHVEKNNQVAEIITSFGTFPNNTYKIYDGATHNLKYTYAADLSDTSALLIGEKIKEYNTLDVNNDGVYEVIKFKSGKIGILNGTNLQLIHEWIRNAVFGTDITITDIDNDGYLEFYLSYDPIGENSERLFIYSTPAQSVGVNENNTSIPSYELKQNYPNPFNPSTRIEYSINKTADVQIKIYDITGREIQSLAKGIQTVGTYKVNLTSENLSSGTYFYQIIIDGNSDAKTMVVAK